MPCHLFLRLLLEPPDNSLLCDGSSHEAWRVPSRIGFRFRDPAPKIGTASLALFASGFGSKDDKGAQRTGTTTTMAMAARDHVCLVSSLIREPWSLGYSVKKKDGSTGVAESATRRRGWLRDQEYKLAAQSGFVAVCEEVFRRFEDRHSGSWALLLRKTIFSTFNWYRPQRLCEVLHFLNSK
jgi:hypothetical protein